MADVSDPMFSELYHRVRDDDDELNWLIATYEGRSNKVIVHASGNGDVEEMKENLAEDMVGYCYLRVISGDEESRRAKFVFLTWIGNSIGVMRKAKISVHKPFIKEVLRESAVEMTTSDLPDINEEDIMTEVRRAGGADYMGNW